MADQKTEYDPPVAHIGWWMTSNGWVVITTNNRQETQYMRGERRMTLPNRVMPTEHRVILNKLANIHSLDVAALKEQIRFRGKNGPARRAFDNDVQEYKTKHRREVKPFEADSVQVTSNIRKILIDFVTTDEHGFEDKPLFQPKETPYWRRR